MQPEGCYLAFIRKKVLQIYAFRVENEAAETTKTKRYIAFHINTNLDVLSCAKVVSFNI